MTRPSGALISVEGKTCRDCDREKPISEFYGSGKLYSSSYCKECTRTRSKETRLKKLDEYRARDRVRSLLPGRVEARAAYQKTERGKAALARAKEKYKTTAADKISARNRLYAAVRDGRLVKPDACQDCGATGQIEGHHADYSRPLDVSWLCRRCHVAEHKQPKAAP